MAAAGGAGVVPSAGATAAAGGGGASAPVAGSGASASAGSLDAFRAKLAPALTDYYRGHSFLVAKSAKEDEVTACVLFALSQLEDPSLLPIDSTRVFKRREVRMPRSLLIEKHEDSFRICVFAKKKIGAGSFKQVKDLLCIDYSLSKGEITISNKALCIHCKKTSGLSAAEREKCISAAREEVKNELRRYKMVETNESFMTVEGSFERIANSVKSPGDEALKIYTLHPRAALGDLYRRVLVSTSSDLLSALVTAFCTGASGMAWLHSVGRVYTDFKPENIFGFEDGTWRLGDLDTILTVTSYLSSPRKILAVSPLYTPPECIDYCIYKRGAAPANPKAHDVWSLGMSILTIAIALGHRTQKDATLDIQGCLIGPPSSVHPYDLLKALKEADIDRTIEYAIKKQPLLARLAPLLKGMLEIDPAKRISMEEARDGLLAFSHSLSAR